MKRRTLILLFVCTSCAWAQSGSRVSLQIGTVGIWLGEDKATAKQQIEAAGMIFNATENKGQVMVVETVGKGVYQLQFENSKLVYADRNWLRDESKALPSVMDALAALIDEGATNCTIAHQPMSSPDMKMNRIFINCGKRSILLTYGSQTIAGQPYTDNEISERIGEYR
jgi:hypothetical protein